MSHALSVQEETKIVALLARGDNYGQIQKCLLEEDNRSVGVDTIAKVKRRNKENLDLIKQRSLQLQADDALSIKNKANELLSKKLSAGEKAAQILAKANDDYLNEEITLAQYVEIVKKIREPNIPELVSVSKEMHAQSTDEKAPAGTQQDMQALIEAIRSGDEVTLNQIIFKGKANDISQHSPAPDVPAIQPSTR